MGFKKRLLAVALVGATALGVFSVSKLGLEISEKKSLEKEQEEIEEALHLTNTKDTLYFWYTDEGMTDYLNSVAVAFNETKEDIRVVPVLKSGSEYMEHINQASVEDAELPDLYLVGNDSLGKAYLAGLATEIVPSPELNMQEAYPQTALQAVTYKGKMVGYPLSYVTSSFVYNKTYLENWIVAKAAAEEAAQKAEEEKEEQENASSETKTEEKSSEEEKEDEASSEATDSSETAVVAEEDVNAIIPKTIDELLTFADEYDAPEQVDGVFRWDVNDIFYNYFFVGDAIAVGGDNGDDIENIDLYNEEAINSMLVYKNLNQFFSIDTEEVSYDGVVQDFIDGKIVFTVIKQDAIAKIEAAKADGTFPYEYGVSLLPDISEHVKARSLSVTNAIAINGYSMKKAAANEFAQFLVEQVKNGDAFLGRTGKVSALKEASYENPMYAAFMEEYEESEPIAKMIETSNYWMKLEVAFAEIWNGENANAILKQLSEEIMTQVTGEDYQEEYIPVEEVVEEEETLEEPVKEESNE